MQQVLAEKVVSRRGALVDISLIILGSLFIAAFAQLSIPLPFTPVPITGQTFAVLLVGMVLGSRRGALALAAYLAEGAAGLPVFAEMRSGIATLFGPTGGYLFGFVAAAWLVGWLAERGFDRSLLKTLAAMTLGNAVIYFFGVLWLSRFVDGFAGGQGALALGMYPFLIGDAIKALLAAMLLPSAWRFIGSR
ncbi:MAG: biotin transporter BioY [Anaerolineales bacterium]